MSWIPVIPVEDQFMNVEKIFPTQQRDVSKLVKALSANKEVKKITIFGSSLTWLCQAWSDIDVFVETTVTDRRFLGIPQEIETPMDLLATYDDIEDEALMQEIVKKGVTVYEMKD